MLEQLQTWKGEVEVNGQHYLSMRDVLICDFTEGQELNIKLFPAPHKEAEHFNIKRITVRRYMLKQATPSFDFMGKWNNNIPMPMPTMVGVKEKQTRGMGYWKLRSEDDSKFWNGWIINTAIISEEDYK